MVRWDPISELARFQRDFGNLFTGPSGTVHQFPAVNVWVNENEAYLTAELPGVDSNDLDVNVEGETVTLSGKRLPADGGETMEYHRRERLYGEFSRTLQLPFRVDSNGVDAKLNRGVLTVKLPRAEEDKPKKITVKAA
jgi:HSP20 family protein